MYSEALTVWKLERTPFVQSMLLSVESATSSDAVKVRNNVAADEEAPSLTAAPLVSTSFAVIAIVGGVLSPVSVNVDRR